MYGLPKNIRRQAGRDHVVVSAPESAPGLSALVASESSLSLLRCPHTTQKTVFILRKVLKGETRVELAFRGTRSFCPGRGPADLLGMVLQGRAAQRHFPCFYRTRYFLGVPND